ncbi:MAG: GIY-YIG nuclease family protein, partial [Patescibacteria group bacterium]|nr:GIY-YIG nuclease family protein [Patescibacteria group bacterium]
MGYIYVIRCKTTRKMYVGQTTRTVKERPQEHVRDARYVARMTAAGKKVEHYEDSALHKAMAKYGPADFMMGEWCEVPDDELNDAETALIAEFDSLAPNGYNLTTGGHRCDMSKETCAKISATRRERIDDLRSEKLKGMPVFFTYRNYPETGEQIILLKHPLCDSKCFSVKEHKTFEAAKEAALKFHNELEKKGEKYEPEQKAKSRSEDGLPKSMYAVGNGYG